MMFRVSMPVGIKGVIWEAILFAVLQKHLSNLFFKTRSGVITYGTNLDPLLKYLDNSAGIGSLVKLKHIRNVCNLRCATVLPENRIAGKNLNAILSRKHQWWLDGAGITHSEHSFKHNRRLALECATYNRNWLDHFLCFLWISEIPVWHVWGEFSCFWSPKVIQKIIRYVPKKQIYFSDKGVKEF